MSMKKRSVMVGNVEVGGDAPVSIQSMANTDTRNVAETVAQIHALENAGCEIIRVAVPDMEAAAAIRDIKAQISIPLVCDIHFDYRLAIASMENGADKIRINPGNIGSRDRVEAVVACAKKHHVPIRIGVNSGSLEKSLLEKYGGVTADALVESALSEVQVLEELDFHDIVVSIKSSDVSMNVEACRKLDREIPYPLHIGVTEAGTPENSIIKSAMGIGALLMDGIGQTIRVSMTGDPVEEVLAAKKILSAAGVRKAPINIVSCPTCGRTRVDLVKIVREVELVVSGLAPNPPITLAVMGCEVNGPGEAREADFGVACGKNKGAIFEKGTVVETVPEQEIAKALLERIKARI